MASFSQFGFGPSYIHCIGVKCLLTFLDLVGMDYILVLIFLQDIDEPISIPVFNSLSSISTYLTKSAPPVTNLFADIADGPGWIINLESFPHFFVKE